jgi:hypothetical protein
MPESRPGETLPVAVPSRDEKWASRGGEPTHWSAGARSIDWSFEGVFRLAIHRRNVFCPKGHSVILSFDWDPLRTESPKEYSEPCPVSGCDEKVAGKLPIGADSDTLELSPGPG